MKTLAMLAAAMLPLAGCQQQQPKTPQTQAAVQAGFTYVPLDPLPVQILPGDACVYSEGRASNQLKPVLQALPDNAVRVAIRQLNATGSATLGPATVGASGNQYQVILDYINADVVNVPVRVFRLESSGAIVRIERLAGFGYADADADAPTEALPPMPKGQTSEAVVIPVYVGVGLRLTANINVLKGSVNLGSLGALAAQAEAENISGSLIVQTLGITGKQVTSTLPLPSELNATTIQNAILALGAVKAIVYDQENTVIAPRVTGIYNPLDRSDEGTVNKIVSELARDRITWRQPCVDATGVPRA